MSWWVLSFHHVGSEDESQVVRLGGKPLTYRAILQALTLVFLLHSPLPVGLVGLAGEGSKGDCPSLIFYYLLPFF